MFELLDLLAMNQSDLRCLILVLLSFAYGYGFSRDVNGDEKQAQLQPLSYVFLKFGERPYQ